MKVIQVVPRIAPESEGVSAFAAALGSAFRVELGCDSTVIAPGLEQSFDPSLLLGSSAGSRALILHYVGYGYHARGVPWRLARAWERARDQARGTGVRFGVLFHEVAAFGPPWRSSFWTHPFQRQIARRLLRASDLAATSLEQYRRLLGSLAPEKSVEVIAIPSTIGEPAELPSFADREARLVVFGSGGVRGRAWGEYRAELAAAARALDVSELVDVGAEAGAPEQLDGRRVVRRGVVDAAAVSELLARSRGGFLAYPPDFLGKSTIHAAYAAHGVVPVCAWRGRQARAPRPDEPWVAAGEIADPAAVAARARAHYDGRCLARHAEVWRRLLEPR